MVAKHSPRGWGYMDVWMDNRIIDLLLAEFLRILNFLVFFECVRI